MQIKVTPHTITLNKTEIVNEGEYNINTCEFELSEEYTGLTNMAIFTNGTNTFKTMIVNNECVIPYEVLEDEGTLMVGVYGYEADGETLVKRYSPTPVAFYIEKGSYALAQEGEQPSPSIIEQLQEEIEQNSNDIATLQESVSSINQELPSFAKKTEIPTKTSQLQNDSGFITKSVNDLENYTKTSDLSSVATSGAYSDLSGTPDLSLKQDKLVSGTNIKTINNETILGSGNINISGGGTSNYNELSNKPTINNIELSGNKSSNDLGLQNVIDSTHKLSSDLVDDTNATNKFVSASDITNWNNKQNALTFDTTPTSGSTNPVTSGGIYTYVNNIVGDINTALDTINGEVI